MKTFIEILLSRQMYLKSELAVTSSSQDPHDGWLSKRIPVFYIFHFYLDLCSLFFGSVLFFFFFSWQQLWSNLCYLVLIVQSMVLRKQCAVCLCLSVP